MSRSLVYNQGMTGGFAKVSEQNKALMEDFLGYAGISKSPQTVNQYRNWLMIFFCWNLEHNENRFFVDVKKREIASYFGWLSEKGSSPARIGTLKAVLSSLSNYVELMYEDKYPNFHNQTKGIESLPPTRVRKKTVLTPDEVNGILKKLVDDKEYEIACYVALICASGCRKAEALQVKPSFFVEGNEVFEGFMYKTPLVRGKGRGKAGKPMCKYVIKSIFKPYFDLWMAERDREGIWCPDALFVKGGGRGRWTPAGKQQADYFASKISRDFNIDFYAHCLRHYFCTYLKSKGLPDDVITEVFSWASADMVKIYDDTPADAKLEKWFAPEGAKGAAEEAAKEIPNDGGSKGK